MKTISTTFFICALLFAVVLNAQEKRPETEDQRAGQKYRPLYHFSPAKGWIGDPDGLVFHQGIYHLFWWGHATSTDLVHWKELPRPMKGDDGSFSYFSGSVAVDSANTAGFGKNSMIAVYTRHLPGDSLPETQAISVSNDNGLTFQYYQHNPVLDINKVFFRDPQVFWYKPSGMWKMVVTLPDVQQIHIYESADLKNWKFCSSFTGLGARNSFWECPDLFEVPVAGTGKKKWVMMIGRGPNKVQYFPGEFDGKIFKPDRQTVDYLSTGKGLEGLVFDDFEKNGLANWTNTGEAFKQTVPEEKMTDYLGVRYAGSSLKKSATGKLISKTFEIKHNAINFLIAGGNHPDTTCISLIVDNKMVRTTTGDNTSVLKWRGWDVRDLKGRQARIEIKDDGTDTASAFIAVDHILFSDKLMNQGLEHALWLDYGPDHYATRTWRNYDKHQDWKDTVYAIGWMGNWEYANKVPTSWGKGFESIPRTFGLKHTDKGYELFQQPIPQLRKLRNSPYQTSMKLKGKTRVAFSPQHNSYELETTFKPSAGSVVGLSLMEGDGRELLIRYDSAIGLLTIDRTNCTDFTSDTSFTKLFSRKFDVPLSMQNGELRLHIFVDRSSVEIFANDGSVSFSAVTFPSDSQMGISAFAENGEGSLTLNAWELNSIWTK